MKSVNQVPPVASGLKDPGWTGCPGAPLVVGTMSFSCVIGWQVRTGHAAEERDRTELAAQSKKSVPVLF